MRLIHGWQRDSELLDARSREERCSLFMLVRSLEQL